MIEDEKTVFISYRRDSSRLLARIVFQDLRENGYDVFRDVESIDSGEFDKIIVNQIAARTHFVLILSHGSLERCNDPNDWLRREIEEAIKLDRNIVPMLFDGFTFKDAEAFLPDNIQKLMSYNALSVPLDDQYFDAAMSILRERFLKKPDYTIPIRPTSTQEAAIVRQRIAQAASEPQPTEQELSAEQHFSRGIARFAAADYKGAIAQYTEAVKLNPTYNKLYYNRALAYQQAGDIDQALADYDESLRLDPTYVKPLINRATIHYDRNNFKQAIDDCNAVLALDPDYAKAYYNRALVYAILKQIDESVTDFEKYLSLVGEEDEHRQHVETMIASLRVQLKADESGRDSGLLTGLFFRPQGQSDAKSESGDSEGSNLPGELPASSPGENRGITKQENRSLQSVMVAVMLLAVLAIVSIIVGLLLRPDATTANDTSSANQFTPVLAIMVVVGTVLFIGWRIWFDIQRRAQQDDSVVSPGFSATAATQRTMIPESATRPPSRPSGLPSLSAASESTALDMMYEGATRPLPPPAFIPDHKTSLVCGLATDVGLVRSNNQDACVSFVRNVSDYEDLPNFGLFIVADGMGGHHDGEKASSLAIRTIESEIINTVYLPLVSGRQDAERPPFSEMLNSAVKKANVLVVEQVPDGGTTVTAAMIVGNLMHIAHVGDSRAYLVTRESIEQITRDHSLVQRLVELDQLAPEDAKNHPQKNILYRALGQSEVLEVDIMTRHLPPEAAILLCSDGLWGLVEQQDLLKITTNYEPQDACNHLIALANTHGGTDNITSILVRI